MRDQQRSHLYLLISVVTTLVVVVVDCASKLFFSHILAAEESIPVVRNIFHFTLVHNTGIAFGLFKNMGIVFIIIPIIVIIFIISHLYHQSNNKDVGKVYIFAFSLILGGAIGNLVDRIVFGYVIDFIDFRVWPVFNVADSAITIGTIIVFLKCIPSFVKYGLLKSTPMG
jgi:signal peptidase II